MSLVFALGFLAFAILGYTAAKDASKYHKEYAGIAVNGIVVFMSIVAMFACLAIFVFVELPMYGIIIWSIFK